MNSKKQEQKMRQITRVGVQRLCTFCSRTAIYRINGKMLCHLHHRRVEMATMSRAERTLKEIQRETNEVAQEEKKLQVKETQEHENITLTVDIEDAMLLATLRIEDEIRRKEEANAQGT